MAYFNEFSVCGTQNRNFGVYTAELKARKLQEHQDSYLKHPTLCKQCNSPLPYEKRHGKFCSDSCSAACSNSRRTISDEQRLRTSLCLKSKNTKKPKKTPKRARNAPTRLQNVKYPFSSVRPCKGCKQYMRDTDDSRTWMVLSGWQPWPKQGAEYGWGI
jgi:hypothetical protein